MTNNNLFRFAGWSAILSIVLSFGMFGVIMATGGERNVAFIAVSVVAAVFTAVAPYALYVFHRPQSAMISLAMLVCVIVGLVLENFGTGPGTTLGMFTNVVYGAGFLLIGYLGFGTKQMPRWIAIFAYLVGFTALAAAGAVAIGQTALAENVLSMLVFLAWIVWSVGLAILFLSRKLTTA